MIPPCPRCGGYLTLDVDGVYLKEEYRCEGCSRRFDENLELLCGEADMGKFLKKHGLINDFKMAFAKSKRYR